MKIVEALAKFAVGSVLLFLLYAAVGGVGIAVSEIIGGGFQTYYLVSVLALIAFCVLIEGR